MNDTPITAQKEKPGDEKKLRYYALNPATVFGELSSSPNGLASDEVGKRLERYGANRLIPAYLKSPLARFLSQFNNVLIYVLLVAGFATALLAHWIDSGVIFGVVLINAVIGFIQEGKAEKALDAIRNMLSQQASVKRDGVFKNISADQLIPGDVVFVQSGDKVPADLRLFKQRELQIDEAMLTGESSPVEKSVEAVADNAAIGDRHCMAHSGSLITYGQGQGVVVATGDNTEIGQISGLLREVKTLDTPLIRQMDIFALWLTGGIAIVAILTFAYGVAIQNYSLGEMFLAAVGLAVACIPEGLPAIMTITLAIGVQRMARKHAIIRRLPAVETLGSVTVICSDKTGTLTRNEMTVVSVAISTGQCEVSGAGYSPHGTFTMGGADIEPDQVPLLAELSSAAILCNDAVLAEVDGEWKIEGDPTEGALLRLGQKAGLNIRHTQQQFPRDDAIPFESQHRFMATLHHDHSGHQVIYLKGAPQRVLEMCHLQRSDNIDVSIELDYWETCMETMATRGQRLLAIAMKTAPAETKTLTLEDVDSGLTLLGLVGIIDPPRHEATIAVQTCQAAGIKVKMITGDHVITARSIGAQMGIGDGVNAVTGKQIEF